METKKRIEFNRGVVVFASLAVLTVVEYYLGTHEAASILLWVIAIIKAGLVVWFFMHLGRVLGRTEGGH